MNRCSFRAFFGTGRIPMVGNRQLHAGCQPWAEIRQGFTLPPVRELASQSTMTICERRFRLASLSPKRNGGTGLCNVLDWCGMNRCSFRAFFGTGRIPMVGNRQLHAGCQPWAEIRQGFTLPPVRELASQPTMAKCERRFRLASLSPKRNGGTGLCNVLDWCGMNRCSFRAFFGTGRIPMVGNRQFHAGCQPWAEIRQGFTLPPVRELASQPTMTICVRRHR
ncbi:hypothetical protein APED_02685 [Acanthopleuribacter pedis]